jgi:uncharacterized protein (DUF779 family)
MLDPQDSERITGTPAAREVITDLLATDGRAVMFVQAAECCSGGAPVCSPDLEYVVGDADVLLGHVEGCPFYLDRRLDDAEHHEHFVLDVEAGEPEGFSLEAGTGRHFVTRLSVE